MSDEMFGALKHSDAYPWPVKSVELVETHISWVFLAGERVVKLKRPVQYSFVDYSTLELRHQACQDEVRLNRLLSDDIYLRVVPIVRVGERFLIGEGNEGEVVDWATLMRRIPEREMLDVRMQEDTLPGEIAKRLADRLVPFHMEVAPRCTGPDDEMLQSQNEVIRENIDELEPFSGHPLPPFELVIVREAVFDYLDVHSDRLLERVKQGWIREGHGDLRCEHIVMPDDGTIQIYDCVEFNRDLRCADIASDLAFLLMDLVRLDAPAGTIDTLLRRYRETGAVLPLDVVRLYWIHRALVRAKVHCLQVDGQKGEQRLTSVRKAVEYLHIATSQAITARPTLIVMSGLSGTGKSTVAEALSRTLGVRRIASDEVRKVLASKERNSGDIYTAEWNARTYEEMFRHGGEELAAGRVVILDATFLDERSRADASGLASTNDVPMMVVETITDEGVVLRRLNERTRRGESISDATAEVYRRQRERHNANPPSLPAGSVHVQIDTSLEEPASLDPALSALANAELIMPHIPDTGSL